MRAKDVVITTIEMELMYKSTLVAFENYMEGFAKLTDKQKEQCKLIKVTPHNTLKEFTEAALIGLASVSHGDVVLIEGKELRRIPANYTKPVEYVKNHE